MDKYVTTAILQKRTECDTDRGGQRLLMGRDEQRWMEVGENRLRQMGTDGWGSTGMDR